MNQTPFFVRISAFVAGPASVTRFIGAWFVLAIILISSVHAQSAGSGTIRGRISDPGKGSYLKNVRVTVENMNLEEFTNDYGEYRLANVPAGTVTLKVIYTGFSAKLASVKVVAGQTEVKDFEFGTAESETVKLAAFVVASVKETNASAIAINEQRYAGNLKNVVAADEFGSVTEGNVGEFLKFLPGVQLEYVGADARTVSVRGIPSANSAVTVNGNRISNAGSGVPARAFEFDQLSINNVSRIEVTKAPTPESPADAIGGSINLVPKSAFERSRPEFTYRAYLALNQQTQQDVEFISLRRTVGPGREDQGKVKPGFDFSYVNPVSKNFGFTLTGVNSNIFAPQYISAERWSPTTGAGTGGTLAAPVMNQYTVTSIYKNTSRKSIGTTLDWRLGARDVLSLGASYSTFDSFFNGGNIQSNAAVPTAYSPTFTQGGPTSSLSKNTQSREANRSTYIIDSKYRHDGPVWKIDGGIYTSHSKAIFRDVDHGYFTNTSSVMNAVVVRYDDINQLRPNTTTVTTPAGAPVDFRSLGNYSLSSVSASPVDSVNTTQGANFNISRFVDVGIPLKVKLGSDLRRVIADYRNPSDSWTFVGPDGVNNTPDNLLKNYDAIDPSFSAAANPYRNGKWEYPSAYKIYDLFVARPQYFTRSLTGSIQQNALNSKVLTEDVFAHFVRLDARLFENRLWIVTGVRYERTRDDGYGPINDLGRTYQRDAAGNIIRVNGVAQRLSTDPVVLAGLQYVDRGAHVSKDYGDFYPSVNATWNISPNLLARASFAQTISRPNYGSITPGTTLPDPTSATARTITINNVNLKPWSAKNFDLSLSYYPTSGGEVNAGIFRKDIKDFFGGKTFAATPELLDQYGIDKAIYGDGTYFFSTLDNVGSARISGVEFSYRQPLKFLPSWGRGVNVRYNITQLHLEGQTLADFSQFIQRNMNWGVSLDRPSYNVRLNWNYRGRQRQALNTAAIAEPGTYNYLQRRLTLDFDAEYRFTQRVGLFIGVRNLTGVPFIVETYGPNTPGYARRNTRSDYGAAISVGLKGSF